MKLDEAPVWPAKGLQAEASKLRAATLRSAVDDFDKIISMVSAARDQIAQSPDDALGASLVLAKLQNPVRDAFDAVNSDLKEITKLQRAFGKALDKNLPVRPLPTETDAMANHTDLIDRAILMHLLREGDSAVAATFMQEAKPSCAIATTAPARPQARHPPPPPPPPPPPAAAAAPQRNGNGLFHTGGDTSESDLDDNDDDDDDEDDDEDDGDDDDGDDNNANGDDDGFEYRPASYDDAITTAAAEPEESLSSSSSSRDIHSPRMLQDKFSEMYALIDELRARNLEPAISWAQTHSDDLEARGSNLEFELVKLQFIWLFKGARVNGLPDDRSNGVPGALSYAHRLFPRFKSRYHREIQQLAGALPFASNLKASPYKALFDTSTAFDDAVLALTRDFCSLLGLAAQSPLHAATVAGAIALPQLIKYTTYMRAKKTEWTTSDELAYETPLPKSMIYHPIFVCPVLKVQTTDVNPPMMLPCGHVICREALHSLSKSPGRFKCPYCPVESGIKDAIQIKF